MIRQDTFIKSRILRSEIYRPRFIGIREDLKHAVHFIIIMVEICYNFSLPQCENIITVTDAVDQSFCTGAQNIYIHALNPRIIHRFHIQFIVKHIDSVRCADIDTSIIIFTDHAGFQRLQAVGFSPHPDRAVINHGNAAVIGAYPQSVFRIRKETADIADAHRGIHSFKCVSVIADKPAVASDPDKSIACLCNIIRFGCRQSVPVVIKHSRVAFTVSDRINNGIRTGICIETDRIRKRLFR